MLNPLLVHVPGYVAGLKPGDRVLVKEAPGGYQLQVQGDKPAAKSDSAKSDGAKSDGGSSGSGATASGASSSAASKSD